MPFSGKEQHFVSTHRYVSDDFLRLEEALIFPRTWVMACLSSRLSEKKSHVVFEHKKHSVLIVRSEDGIARAFVNACLHRGTKLVSGSGKNQAITCPYHGWAYDHYGKLRGIAKKEGISVPLGECLPSVPVHEESGMIWICLGNPKEKFPSFLGRICSDLQAYHLEEMTALQACDFTFDANWKIALENALDYYHVPTVHQSTVNAHVRNQPTFRPLGNHNLQTLHIAPYPWRQWIDQRCARGGSYTEHQLASLHKYFIFPNLILNVLPYHLTIMQLWPVTATKCVMRYRFCMRKKPGLLERFRAYVSWMASRFILYEDVKIYKKIQQGMELTRKDRQPLHKEEQSIAHFHHTLGCWLQGKTDGIK